MICCLQASDNQVDENSVERKGKGKRKGRKRKGCTAKNARKKERGTYKDRESEQEVVTDTFSGSGTQKALPTRPPVEHEATRGV